MSARPVAGGARATIVALALALPGTAVAEVKQTPLSADAPVAAVNPTDPAALPVAEGEPSAALQDQSPRLADLRARLTVAQSQLQELRAQLRAQGAPGYKALGGPDKAIDRMNTLEADMRRLTAETQSLTNRLDRALASNRTLLDDLEFRICEMEPACDLGALTTPTESTHVPPAATRPTAPAVATAAEQAAFDQAKASADAGEPARAAAQWAFFLNAHPASPLAVPAMLAEGQALSASGDDLGAARAWLTAFAAQPNGPGAADALLGVADALAKGGANPERACYYLAELSARFPLAPQAATAESRSKAMACPEPDLAEPGTGDPAATGLPVDSDAAADPASHATGEHPASSGAAPAGSAEGAGLRRELIGPSGGDGAALDPNLPAAPDDPEAAADEAAGLTSPR